MIFRLALRCLSLIVLVSLSAQASPSNIEYVANPLEDAFFDCHLWGETGRSIALARDANKSRSVARADLMTSALFKAGKAYTDHMNKTSQGIDGPLQSMNEFADKLTEMVYYSRPVLSPAQAGALLYTACYGGKPFKAPKQPVVR